MNLNESFDAAIRATHATVAHRRQHNPPGYIQTSAALGICPFCRELENARVFAVTNYYAEAESLTERPNLLKGPQR